MTDVPKEMPLTMPDADPIVVLVLLLVHTPPALELVSVADDPTHTEELPPITEGSDITLTVVVTKHPVPNE
jgi:hypothetical protein